MEIHDLQQGTPEWDKFRLEHRGASEAAAMLGLSTKVTRNELLAMKATGVAKVFGDWVQRNILDYGHEVEALARPIIEKQIGQKLYPVTCSDGIYSASCDGLTMAENIAFEHKQWNEALAASVREGVLPEEYMPQCQQVLMVTGAGKVVFTVSDGTPEKLLTLDVFPDLEWFDRIRAGWAQFDIDVQNYQHKEAAQEVAGRAPDALPALRIEVTGMVTASNLAEFKAHALGVFAGIKTELQTDEDFANADKTVKWCKEVEDRLEAAKQHALSQTASIDELFRTVDAIKEEARQKRLTLDGLVKKRKESIRIEMVQAGNVKYAEHVAALQSEIPGIKLNLLLTNPDLGGAIKGLKTIASIQNAIDTALANAKIAADAVAKDVRDKLAWCKDHAAGLHALFPDLQALIGMDSVAFQAVITNRINEHKAAEAAKLEAERARIQAEEEAKARAKVEAEERARIAKERAEQEAMLAAERKRLLELESASSSGGKQEVKSTDDAGALIDAINDDDDASAAVGLHTSQVAKKRPTKLQMAQAVADHFGVSVLTADEWLRTEFSLMAA